MKHIPVVMLLLFSVASAYAQPKAEKITVEIKDGKFNIDKVNVTDGWKQAEVSADLGTDNDRKRAGYNTTHTYDGYGIVLFEKNADKLPSGILTEVQFYLAAGDTNRITPSSFFVGKIQVEKLKLGSAITPDELKNKLKDYVQTDSYMEHSFRLSYKGLYIYFLFNKEETQLLKISVGKDTKSK